MITTYKMSGLCKDYLMSNIRSQVASLNSVLFNLENSEQLEMTYVDESLRELERSIRELRKNQAMRI